MELFTQVERLNVAEQLEHLERLISSLETTSWEKAEILKSGFSASSSIKDVLRTGLNHIFRKLFNLDELSDKPASLLFLLEQGLQPQQEEQLALIMFFWNKPEAAPEHIKELIIDTQQVINNFVIMQTYTHLGETGFRKRISDYTLDKKALADMYTSGKRRIFTEVEEVDFEREVVELQNITALKTELTEQEGAKAIIEISPPVHSHQKEIMLRIYVLKNGIWQAKSLMLPYHAESSSQLLSKLTKIAEEAEVKQRTRQTFPKANRPENTALQKLFVLEHTQLDINNLAQLTTHLYNPDLNYLDLLDSSEEAGRRIEHTLVHIKPMISRWRDNFFALHHPSLLNREAKVLKNVLNVSDATQMSEQDFNQQNWTGSEIRNFKAGAVASAARGTDPNLFISKIAPGKTLVTKASGDCVVNNASYSSERTDATGLRWRSKTVGDEVLQEVLCPECGQRWVEACDGSCDLCKQSAGQLRETFERTRNVVYSQKTSPSAHENEGIGTAIGKMLSNMIEGIFLGHTSEN